MSRFYNPYVGMLDEFDLAIRDRRIIAWNKRTGPRVGDFCLLPDGTETRFTNDWGKGIQTTSGSEPGSFYFGEGWMDYSGALDPGIPRDSLEDTGQVKPGAAWIFHHDQPKAHNAVAVAVPCRVYRVKRTLSLAA
jgi:hypothetical protein